MFRNWNPILLGIVALLTFPIWAPIVGVCAVFYQIGREIQAL